MGKEISYFTGLGERCCCTAEISSRIFSATKVAWFQPAIYIVTLKDYTLFKKKTYRHDRP